jgi:type 1 glutamine amidotransferase
MPTNVLIVSDGWFHPPVVGRLLLRKFLSELSEYRFEYVKSMEELPRIDITSYAGFVLYFHQKTISDPALKTFDAFVTNGGGILAIHSVSASFKDSNYFTDILGGKFSGHGPIETFKISPVSPAIEIFRDVPAFHVRDELYMHDLQPDIEVYFASSYQGQSIPIVWTRLHGKGRVCYACPGHQSATFRNRDYQRVLQQGLAWVCRQD